MNIENLVNELSYNPDAMKKIEVEVDKLVSDPSIAPLYALKDSKSPAVTIYVAKVLELRIKARISTFSFADEIKFAQQLLLKVQSYHVCEVYATLGLFCWPALMPSFFDDILALFNSKAGYQILLSFLEKLNSSTDIDDTRRAELKKAMSYIYKDILARLDDNYAEYVIPIHTQLLKIIPKDYDFSVVYRKAAEFPGFAIEFFSEGVNYINQNTVVDLLENMPCDTGLPQVLYNFKTSKLIHLEKIYHYSYRCLSSFWQKVFSRKGNEAMVDQVLTEVIKAFLSVVEEFKEDIDAQIYGFFSILCKNYPEHCTKFLALNANFIPPRISSNFLQKIAKGENGKNLLSTLNFESAFLNCQVSFLRDDPSTPSLLFNLDFSDNDSVRLAVNIIAKYPFDQNQIMGILKKCENGCLNANEICAGCYMQLGMHDSFDGEWDMNKVIRFYYYIKKSPAEYLKYKNSYLSLFLRNAPFDRCFSILEKLDNIPQNILESIYEKIDKYPYIELCCFNNDLLPHLEQIAPFIQKEVYRFVTEWETVVDYKDYYQAIKSLLGVFSSKIESANITDMLIDLMQIDCGIVMVRVLAIFNNYKSTFNTRKALYHLITAYSSPNMSDSQPLLVAALTECMYQPDGSQSFSEVLGLDINKCCEVRAQMAKTNRRSAQNLIRDLLKDLKGKSYNKLFETDFKVTKQNFLTPQKRKTKTICQIYQWIFK